MTSRRKFLQAASVSGAAALVPRIVSGMSDGGRLHVIGDPGHRPLDSAPVLNDPDLRALAHRALDAATAAGAQYAEARFTLTRLRSPDNVFDGTLLVAVGVRALVNGAWGFVASPWWTDAEAVRLGTQAARQAATNRWYPTGGVELGAPPVAATGSWSTPVTRDLFEVPVEEVQDLVASITSYLYEQPDMGSMTSSLGFHRQERTIATTDGAFFTQLLHTAFINSSLGISVNNPTTHLGGSSALRWLTPTGGGYELLERVAAMETLDQLLEEARQSEMEKATQVTVGRYSVVLDGYAMASLVASTIGEPSEVDRVRGFEANAGGTSYLAPPAETLGLRHLSSPLLTVRGNRSMRGGAATVKWDDEGVVPDEFDIVKDGVVMDYATSRQHVALLSEYYRAHGQALRSHGCSGGGTAMDFPVVTTPNLVMQPSPQSITFDDMVASVSDGYALMGGTWDMDQQGLNGQWNGLDGGRVYRIKNGRMTAVVDGAAFLIRSPDTWKNLVTVGGAKTSDTRGFWRGKAQPALSYMHSVSAPAATIRNMAIIDGRRKYGG